MTVSRARPVDLVSSAPRVWPTLLLAVTCVPGCEAIPPDASSSAPTVRDSAGVRMVEYADAPTPAGSFEVEPLYRHGHAPGDYPFAYPGFGALQADGSAYVSDGGASEVLRISATGDSASVLAPSGEGPAEVERVLSVTAAGRDSVWIEDDGNAKIALFVGGELERSVSTQGDPVLAYGMRILGLDASGRFLMTQSSYRSDFDEPWLAGQLAVFDPTSEALDSVATFDMAKRRPDGAENPWPAHGVVTASGGEFVHARSDRPELVWRRADGSVRQIVRWRPDPAYPDEADWEAFRVMIRSELERVNPQMGGERLRTFLDEQVARYRLDPETPLPLFWRLYPGDAGSVWIADFEPGLRTALPRRYEVVSADGRWLGAVEFPMPFEVLDVKGDLVLGSYRDERDVPAIAVYRVRWAER